jgi:TonB family protein
VIASPEPDFPHTSDSNRGEVAFTVIVGTNGGGCGLEVVKSSGPEFERAAIRAVQRWRWKPAMKDGKPVPVRISINVNFARQ